MKAGLDDGRLLRAEAAIVASGAFAASSDLLPVPVALRAKSEVYAMAELDTSRQPNWRRCRASTARSSIRN